MRDDLGECSEGEGGDVQTEPWDSSFGVRHSRHLLQRIMVLGSMTKTELENSQKLLECKWLTSVWENVAQL